MPNEPAHAAPEPVAARVFTHLIFARAEADDLDVWVNNLEDAITALIEVLPTALIPAVLEALKESGAAGWGAPRETPRAAAAAKPPEEPAPAPAAEGSPALDDLCARMLADGYHAAVVPFRGSGDSGVIDPEEVSLFDAIDNQVEPDVDDDPLLESIVEYAEGLLPGGWGTGRGMEGEITIRPLESPRVEIESAGWGVATKTTTIP